MGMPMTRRRRLRLILAIVAVQLVVLAGLIVLRLRSVPPDVARLVRTVARQEGVDPDLAEALVWVESRGDARARSRVGALGLLQLMPATAREVADREGIPLREEEDLLDPGVNARIGLIYLRDMLRRFEGDERLALAAYNAGPGRVERWRRSRPELASEALVREVAFDETRDHVNRVLKIRDSLRAAGR
jgi:soluble lytic murein transglycosylase